jgi:glycine betaine/proline transport system substrate-binding protein
MTLAYELTVLEEPKFDGFSADDQKSHPLYKADGCYKMYQPKDRQDWLEASNITCANPANEVYVAYSASLAKRNPKVAKFLSQVKFETNDVGGWIMAIGRDKKDPQDVAEAWVAANKAKVDAWLAGI